MRKIGNEFGATTGRPRRCGWMDLVALKFACMINGVTQIVMTKADVLHAFENLSICTSYIVDGKQTEQIPFQMAWNKIQPQYRSFKGWSRDISTIKNENELPKEMQDYVQFINQSLGAPIRYISNGPGREQLIKISS